MFKTFYYILLTHHLFLQIPVTIPDAIPRPERLLDLMPPNLIFEGILNLNLVSRKFRHSRIDSFSGVDYWGLTEAQMEDALDELISERERIREELMRPPPKVSLLENLQKDQGVVSEHLKIYI